MVKQVRKIISVIVLMFVLTGGICYADKVKAMTLKNGNTPEFVQQMEQEFNVKVVNEKFTFNDKGFVASINYGTMIVETDDGLIMFSKTIVDGKSLLILVKKVEEK